MSFIQKLLVTHRKIFFPVFALDPIRWYLHWALSRFLTSWPIYNPFKLQLKLKQCKIWLKCQFSHRAVNHRKTCNAPIDALMCPLQIINDIVPLSLTLHGVNTWFIHHLSNVENYLIGHKSETDWPKPKKKCYSGQPILTPFCQFWGQNSKYPMLQKPANFSTSGKTSLNSPANGPEVTYSKIQNRLSRPP